MMAMTRNNRSTLLLSVMLGLLAVGCTAPTTIPTISVAAAVTEQCGPEPTPVPPGPLPLPTPGGSCPDCGGVPNPGWLGDGQPRSDCPNCTSEWDHRFGHETAANSAVTPIESSVLDSAVQQVQELASQPKKPLLAIFVDTQTKRSNEWLDICRSESVMDLIDQHFEPQVIDLATLTAEEIEDWRISRAVCPALAVYDYTDPDSPPTLRGGRANLAPLKEADLKAWLRRHGQPAKK